MTRVKVVEEEVIVEKLRGLSRKKKRTVLDFVEFLEWQEKAEGWSGFDEWAEKLAGKKRFDHLTEEEVARIVSEHRGENQ